MPDDLYTRAISQVQTLLAPLLDTANPAGPLKEISVEDFPIRLTSNEAIVDFMGRFLPRSPCGILHLSGETFRGPKPANARVAHSNLNFSFMAVIPELRGTSYRRATAGTVRSAVVSALSDIEITAESGVNYAFRPLELANAWFADLEKSALWSVEFSIPADTTLTSYT